MVYLIRKLLNYQHVGDYMKENIAVKSIENIWQDPQCFCISEFIRDEFFYYFKCLDIVSMKKGSIVDAEYLGCFNIENMLAVKHTRFTKTEIYPVDIDHDYKCYYYEVNDSNWLNNILNERTKNDSDWNKYDTNIYKHFILENKEYWVEVIGSNLIFSKKEKDEAKLVLWDTI